MPRPRVDCDRSDHTKKGKNKATVLDKALNRSAFKNSHSAELIQVMLE